MCPCCLESQLYCGMHQKKHSQQVEGVLHSALGLPAQEGHRPVGSDVEETIKISRGLEHLSYEVRLKECCGLSQQAGKYHIVVHSFPPSWMRTKVKKK